MKKNKKHNFYIAPKPVVINRFCVCGQERGARFGKDNNQCSRCWKPLCDLSVYEDKTVL